MTGARQVASTPLRVWPLLSRDALWALSLFLLAGIAGEVLVQHRRASRLMQPVVSLAEMKQRVAAGDALILDARPAGDFAMGRIPGALSFPVSEYRSRVAALDQTLRNHRNRLIIVYCAGRWCDQAGELQAALLNHGQRRVSVFADGFDTWHSAGLPVGTSP